MMNPVPSTDCSASGRGHALGAWLSSHMAVCLPILLTLTLSLYQYAHTASVTEDSVVFIRYARQLGGHYPDGGMESRLPPRSPWAHKILDHLNQSIPALKVVEREEQHPGYPLAVLGVWQVVGQWLSDDPVLQWARAGQVASILGGLLLTLAIYSLGTQLLDQAAALAAALILSTVPAWVYLRCDVLSDAPALAFLALSARSATRLFDGGGARAAMLCGLWGAVGYLFRPEAAQVAVLAGMFLVWRVATNPSERRRAFGWGLVLALPLVLVCLPYMFLKGSVLTKQATILENRKILEPGLAHPLTPDEVRPDPVPAEKSAAARFAAPLLPRPFFLIAAGVKRFFLGWSRDLGDYLLLPLFLGLCLHGRLWVRRSSHALVATTVLLNLALLPVLLYYKKGYLDHRNVLPVTVLTSFWCWPGLRFLAFHILRLTICNLQSAICNWKSRLAALALAILLAVFTLQTISRPLHAERNGYRLAGEWLRGRVANGTHIIDPENLVAFYADLDAQNRWDITQPPLSPVMLESLLNAYGPVVYLVFSDRYLKGHGLSAGVPKQTWSHQLAEVRSFPASLDPAASSQVRIFQVERDGGLWSSMPPSRHQP